MRHYKFDGRMQKNEQVNHNDPMVKLEKALERVNIGLVLFETTLLLNKRQKLRLR